MVAKYFTAPQARALELLFIALFCLGFRSSRMSYADTPGKTGFKCFVISAFLF